MQLKDVGEVFVTREYQVTGSKNKIVVLIGKPQKFPPSDEFPGSNDFYCPFQILGLEDEKVEYSGGVDGIQALLLTLAQIEMRLRDTDEYRATSIAWYGAQKAGDLGLPKGETIINLFLPGPAVKS